MKTKFASIKSLGGYLRLGVAAGTALLSCGLPLDARAAAFDSPVGTWDVNVSGSRKGLALFEFNGDNTFSVFEIIVPNKPASPSSDSDDSRNDGEDDSRNGSGSSSGSTTPTVTSTTNLFGSELISNGRWSFDAQGKVIGFYGESIAQVCTPITITVSNIVAITNEFGDVSFGYETNTITITNCVAITNGVDFIGTVVPGKRLTLAGHTFGRKVVFQGLPILTLTNIAGDYYGNRIRSGLSTLEFFTLSPASPPVELPDMANVYDIFGNGSSYGYNDIGGHALYSRWNKIAFAIPLDPDGAIIRATVGSFDRRHLQFTTHGVEQSAGDFLPFITFKGFFSPPVD